jgi:hypothetical protein
MGCACICLKPERGVFSRLLAAGSRMSVNDRMNLVFQDADIIPLFVQARVLPPMLVPCCC